MNRYDMLMAKATKLRKKIYNKNTNANVRIEKLNAQIKTIQNNKNVYCEKLNNQLTDVTSLIQNEQRRIMEDAKMFGTQLTEN